MKCRIVAGCAARAAAALLLSSCGASRKGAEAPAPPSPVATASVPSGCSAEPAVYQPQPASSALVQLPAVPTLPQRAIKVGDAFTVWGASYYLRSRVHRAEVAGARLTLEGYIVKTNLPDAPRCAVHRSGQADAFDCKAPLPTFWIADTPNASPKEAIQVLGWASNFAQIYEAIAAFDTGKPDRQYVDEFWGVALPNPLPAVGAKVSVTGTYAATFALAASLSQVDPFMGILRYQSMRDLEPAKELASLPSVRRRSAPPR